MRAGAEAPSARRSECRHMACRATSLVIDMRPQDIAGLGDGYAVGGMAVGEPQAAMFDTLEATVPHLPPERPRYLMGVGKPADLVGSRAGDVGTIERIDLDEHEVTIRFDERSVKYDFGELDEVSLAYAVTIHKSQGSEFPAVVIPVATQHYMLLQRNLIYTGITRGKKLVVVIGQKKAMGIAVHNDRPQRRYSGLLASLQR